MRCAGLALATVLAWSMGRIGGSSEPGAVTLGESFVLGVGQSARIEAEALDVGFDGVTADSRCPKGEQCIWEGDATVRVWLQRASEPKKVYELHTSLRKEGGPSESTAGSASHEVRLLRLDPHPITGRAIAKGDYRATLEVRRGSSAAPDR
jgi:hypothetical protein